jgi:protein-disulfide isomerase
MNKPVIVGVAGIAVAFGMLGFGLGAGQSGIANTGDLPRIVSVASAQTVVDRGQVEAIFRDYLLYNPEILVEMQTALEAKQQEAQRIAHLDVIKNAKDEIFNAGYDGFVGNSDGKVTIVEFYDYNCGFCKRAHSDMQALVAADPDLRFVLKEFPILGPDSQKAHVVSMAFRTLMPEKFREFHDQLLGGAGRADEATAIAIALSLGVDETKLREEMKNPAIMESFAKTYDLANRLSISGTPSYVIGNEVVFGALGSEVLSEKIEIAKAACADAAAC